MSVGTRLPNCQLSRYTCRPHYSLPFWQKIFTSFCDFSPWCVVLIERVTHVPAGRSQAIQDADLVQGIPEAAIQPPVSSATTLPGPESSRLDYVRVLPPSSRETSCDERPFTTVVFCPDLETVYACLRLLAMRRIDLRELRCSMYRLQYLLAPLDLMQY